MGFRGGGVKLIFEIDFFQLCILDKSDLRISILPENILELSYFEIVQPEENDNIFYIIYQI